MRSYSNFNFESAVISLINLPFWTFERISAKFQMTIKCTILRVVICPFEHKLISYRYVTVPKQSPLSFNLLELAYAGTLYPPRSFSLFWNPGAYRVNISYIPCFSQCRVAQERVVESCTLPLEVLFLSLAKSLGTLQCHS